MSSPRVDRSNNETMQKKTWFQRRKKGPDIPQKIELAGNPWWTLVILIELFVMLFMSFPRLDDLTWGSSIGLDRLSTWFAGYNGRYAGNLFVIVLTRLPAVLRAGVELMVLCILFYYAHRLLLKKGAFWFFLLSLLCLPAPVLAQSVVWTAGFANYTTSAAVMLFVMYTYYRIVVKEEKLSRVGHIVFLIISFLGQLILENTTFYVMILASCSLIFGLIKNRKVYVPVVTGLISAVCGAVLMFSNSSYHSALVGDGGTYKSIILMPLELLIKYKNEVAPHLVQNNHVLNLALAIVLLFLWLTKNTEGKKREFSKSSKIWSLCGIALTAFFAYDMVENTWTQAFSWGKKVYAIISLLYAIYIIVTISMTVDKKEGKLILLLIAMSQVALVVPLVPAIPLSDRCFFQNGILWAMLLGSMLQILLNRCSVGFDNTGREWIKDVAVKITQIICVCYLAFMLGGQSLSWRIQSIRQEITRSCVEDGAEIIILPEVPYSGIYCYGANLSNSDDYWLTNYKRYYNIPMDIKLEFMDYYNWIAEYGDD